VIRSENLRRLLTRALIAPVSPTPVGRKASLLLAADASLADQTRLSRLLSASTVRRLP
jgi:hypothetical protein